MKLQGFVCDQIHVGVEERTKSVVLVDAIEQSEEPIYRERDSHKGLAPNPKCATTTAFEPNDEQQKEGSSQEIQASCQTSEQIQPKIR